MKIHTYMEELQFTANGSRLFFLCHKCNYERWWENEQRRNAYKSSEIPHREPREPVKNRLLYRFRQQAQICVKQIYERRCAEYRNGGEAVGISCEPWLLMKCTGCCYTLYFLCHKCNLKKILKERWLGHCLHNAFLLGIVMQKVGWELLNVPKHWQKIEWFVDPSARKLD